MDGRKETKIIVKTEDELSDIIEKINSSDAGRIILTFTEDSDLLISSINLSVIKETAEESGKSVIAQIIKNPTGERNAEKAGLTTINTPANPAEVLWDKVEKETKDMQIAREEKLGQRVSKEEIEEEEKVEPQKSSFEKRIEEALKKSKVQPNSQINKTKFVEEEGIKISLDSEIEHNENTDNQQVVEQNDFSENQIKEDTQEETPVNPQIEKESLVQKDFVQMENKRKIVLPKIPVKEIFNKLLPKKKVSATTVIKPSRMRIPKKFLIAGSIGVVFSLVLGTALYLYLVPLVKIKIYVDSKAVEIERSFTGSTDITAVDTENELVPLISEKVDKDVSESLTPTGVSVSGKKATGTVRINYLKIGETLDLPSGTVITTNSLNFVTTESLTLVGPNWGEISAEASDYGSEYNVSSGSYFTIQGYDASVVSGSALENFTGGSKTEKTVLSQADVDTAVKDLSEQAEEDAKNELNKMHKEDDWEIITDSISSTVDEDSIETDVAIGSEATSANVSLTVSVSTVYYDQGGLEDSAVTLLTDEAKNKDLFENGNDVDLELADDINTDFSVTGKDASSIKVKMDASGVVTPKIDKDSIVKNLSGKGWSDGLSYISTFDYSDQKIKLDFDPSFFPEWIRYFPTRQGRILISIIYVESKNN